MSRRCYVCSKGAITGNSITRRGKAKAEGGVGKKTTSTTKRAFLPNLQKRKIVINGEVKKILVCTKCIKGGKLVFASRQTQVTNN